MRRPTQLAGAAAMAIATLVGVTACGGGDGTDADSAGDATALPHDQGSTASGDDSDQSPAQIEQENPKRFLQRWAAAEAEMLHTGTSGPYLALSRDCQECRRLAHTAARFYAAGGFIHGGDWRIDSVRLAPTSTTVVTYTVRGHAAAMESRESSSQPVERVPSRPITYLVGLIAKGSSFTVASRTLAS